MNRHWWGTWAQRPQARTTTSECLLLQPRVDDFLSHEGESDDQSCDDSIPPPGSWFSLGRGIGAQVTVAWRAWHWQASGTAFRTLRIHSLFLFFFSSSSFAASKQTWKWAEDSPIGQLLADVQRDSEPSILQISFSILNRGVFWNGLPCHHVGHSLSMSMFMSMSGALCRSTCPDAMECDFLHSATGEYILHLDRTARTIGANQQQTRGVGSVWWWRHSHSQE